MNRTDLLNRLSHIEWDISHGARRVSQQRNMIAVMRGRQRDVSSAENLLIDLECAQALSLNERDRLRHQIEALSEARTAGTGKPSGQTATRR